MKLILIKELINSIRFLCYLWLFGIIKNRRLGLTLLEIMIALFIVGVAILPMISSLSQNYALAERRLDKEIALKIAEATLNTLLAVAFEQLDKPDSPYELKLHFETPSGLKEVNFPIEPSYNGGPAAGNLNITIGNTTFTIDVRVTRIFQGLPDNTPPANPNPPLLTLSYPYNEYGPGPSGGYVAIATGVATYTSPDNLLAVNVKVSYVSGGQEQEFLLTSHRANLSL